MHESIRWARSGEQPSRCGDRGEERGGYESVNEGLCRSPSDGDAVEEEEDPSH